MVVWGGLHVGAKSNIKFDLIYKTLTSVINISVIRFVFSLYKKKEKKKRVKVNTGTWERF